MRGRREVLAVKRYKKQHLGRTSNAVLSFTSFSEYIHKTKYHYFICLIIAEYSFHYTALSPDIIPPECRYGIIFCRVTEYLFQVSQFLFFQ